MDNYEYERELKDKGIKLIAGVDEVGRGPLVGPVVAACVILPDDTCLDMGNRIQYNWQGRDAYEKEFVEHEYLQLIKFYDALKILHEGDKKAH